MLTSFKENISNESSTFLVALSNSEFNQIAKVNSVGHYQYHKVGQFFTFREQIKIHELQKMSLSNFLCKLEEAIIFYLDAFKIEIEQKDGRFYLSYCKNNEAEVKYVYQRNYKQLFPLVMEFYFYAKNEYLMKKAS